MTDAVALHSKKRMHRSLKSMLKHTHPDTYLTFERTHDNRYFRYTLKRDGDRVLCDFRVSDHAFSLTREGRISFLRRDLPRDLVTHPYEYLSDIATGYGI